MSLYKGTHLIAGNDSVGIEKIIDQKLRERDEKRYYVGSIIIDTKNINPSDYLGFGTWEYFGEGKCLVGVDAGQTEFNTVEKTGGEKTHKLTIDEMPRHQPQALLNTGDSNTTGSAINWQIVNNGRLYGGDMFKSLGGDKPHNNLQPYITVYIWKRIS